MKISNNIRFNSADNKLESLPSFFKSRFKIMTIPIAVALGGIIATDYFLPVKNTADKKLEHSVEKRAPQEKALIKVKNN